jgi:hypothetical protein
MDVTPLQERRQSIRVRIGQLEYIKLTSGNGGIMLDVSQDGLGFQAVAPLEESAIRFCLSAKPADELEALAELVWCDQTRKRGGLRFTYLPDTLQEEIGKLLSHSELLPSAIADSSRPASGGTYRIPAILEPLCLDGPDGAQDQDPFLNRANGNQASRDLAALRASSLESRTTRPKPMAPSSDQLGRNRLATLPQEGAGTTRPGWTNVSRKLSRLRVATIALALALGLAMGVSCFVYRRAMGDLLVRLGERLSGPANWERAPVTAARAVSPEPGMPADESATRVEPDTTDSGTPQVSRSAALEAIVPRDLRAAFAAEGGGRNTAAWRTGSSRGVAGATQRTSAVAENGNRGEENSAPAQSYLPAAGATGPASSIAAEPQAERKSDQSAQNAEVAVPLTPPPTPATSGGTGTSSTESLVMIYLTSDPDGAEINVDNSFAGKTPMTLKLKPGKHAIRMFMNGYHNWSQFITTEAGSEPHIAATLTKSDE